MDKREQIRARLDLVQGVLEDTWKDTLEDLQARGYTDAEVELIEYSHGMMSGLTMGILSEVFGLVQVVEDLKAENIFLKEKLDALQLIVPLKDKVEA